MRAPPCPCRWLRRDRRAGTLAQELCAGQGRGRRGVQPYYLRHGPAVLLCLPSPQPGLPEPSVRVLSVEFLLCGLHASLFPTSCFKTELLGAGGKVDEHFLFICLSGGPPLAMPLPPFHPKNECPAWELCHQGLGNGRLHSPRAERLCTHLPRASCAEDTFPELHLGKCYQLATLPSTAAAGWCPHHFLT